MKNKNLISLLRGSFLFDDEEKREYWINEILPFLDESQAKELESVLRQAEKVEKEFYLEKLKRLQEKYKKLKILNKKVSKVVREEGEKKVRKEEEKELLDLDRELAELENV